MKPCSRLAAATLALALSTLAGIGSAAAQGEPPRPDRPRDAMPRPAVTVSATASDKVANDLAHAWLRAEADEATAAASAAAVNARMARALARVRGVPAVSASTSGYSTWQIAEKGKPVRWRVTQTLALESRDFAALTALASALQQDDALLLSGLSFSVSAEARQKAEDALTQRAIRAWQARAAAAAQGLGFASWTPGNVTVRTSDTPWPMPQMRAMAAAEAAAPPVSVEAGNTDVSVVVSGEAVLEPARPSTR
jgi:predicted secreted protein